ncbi:hypothetical protein LINGRAHAP2_LOCUS11749 [Linum grandiflorum]
MIKTSVLPSRTNLSPSPTPPNLQTRSKSHGSTFKCAKLSPPPEWIDVEFGKLVKEKCRERKGVVELLECLETEAIMGDDEGKDPTDYNRRAQIFDRSSRVFQSLKEQQQNQTKN